MAQYQINYSFYQKHGFFKLLDEIYDIPNNQGHNLLAFSISEKCQQYAIDSKVYLIGNVIDPWHNRLETLGTRLLREETIVKTPSGLFTSELKQMAFTAIRRRNS